MHQVRELSSPYSCLKVDRTSKWWANTKCYNGSSQQKDWKQRFIAEVKWKPAIVWETDSILGLFPLFEEQFSLSHISNAQQPTPGETNQRNFQNRVGEEGSAFADTQTFSGENCPDQKSPFDGGTERKTWTKSPIMSNSSHRQCTRIGCAKRRKKAKAWAIVFQSNEKI